MRVISFVVVLVTVLTVWAAGTVFAIKATHADVTAAVTE
jgi:hypothetical protein